MSPPHITNMKKNENLKKNICGNLKVVAILLELQGGFSNFDCFSCPSRERIGISNALVSSDIFLSPLHIKWGLTENFVKAMNKDNAGFQDLKPEFS